MDPPQQAHQDQTNRQSASTFAMRQSQLPPQAHTMPPQHQMPLPPQSSAPYQQPPRIVPFNKSWHTAKIVLRSIDIVFAIIAISLVVYLVTLPADDGYFWFFGFLVLVIPPAAMVLIWETSELITICARGGRLGIHPGAHVGIHLIIWLYLAVSVGMGSTVLAVSSWTYYDDEYGYSYNTPFETEADWQAGVNTIAAVIAFAALLLIINFTLFVRACVEVNLRNRQSAPIVVMQGTPGGPYYVVNPNQLPMMQQPQFIHQQQQPAYPPAAYGGGPQQFQEYQQPRQSYVSQSTSPIQEARSLDTTTIPENGAYGGGAGAAGEKAQLARGEEQPREPGSGVDGSFYGPGNAFHAR